MSEHLKAHVLITTWSLSAHVFLRAEQFCLPTHQATLEPTPSRLVCALHNLINIECGVTLPASCKLRLPKLRCSALHFPALRNKKILFFLVHVTEAAHLCLSPVLARQVVSKVRGSRPCHSCEGRHLLRASSLCRRSVASCAKSEAAIGGSRVPPIRQPS